MHFTQMYVKEDKTYTSRPKQQKVKFLEPYLTTQRNRGHTRQRRGKAPLEEGPNGPAARSKGKEADLWQMYSPHIMTPNRL